VEGGKTEKKHVFYVPILELSHFYPPFIPFFEEKHLNLQLSTTPCKPFFDTRYPFYS